MKPPLSKDELAEISQVVDLGRSPKFTDAELEVIHKEIISFDRELFKKRIDDIRVARDGVTSKVVKKLLSECDKGTQQALLQYQSQMYFLARFVYGEFMGLRRLGAEASNLSASFNSLPNQHQLALLGSFGDAVEEIKSAFHLGKADQNEVFESFLVIARNLFGSILPINNSATHLETGRELLWATLSSYGSLGLLEYAKILRRSEPSMRRNIELRNSGAAIEFYEEYLITISDWCESSRAWQLRVEDDLNTRLGSR